MSKYRRRLQALEHALLHIGIEREVDQFIAADDVQERIADAANRYGIDRDQLADEMRAREIRIRQIGWNAYQREAADELGLPMETLVDPDAMERYIEESHRAYAAHWADMRSKQEYWRNGVLYRGGERVS